ncbi:hypothetical protein HYV43_05950 [Candidatus Micrarchaeota archaeon]|nr:hypothetical protein [Candidatus Micrarchaeota archaeon]
MGCTVCSDINDSVEADVLAQQRLPACVEKFEDFGYYGDDLDAFHLLKCPQCGAYFGRHDWDHFEQGGAVGVRVERIGFAEAAEILEKVVEKIKDAEWLSNRYDVKKIKKELARLKMDGT